MTTVRAVARAFAVLRAFTPERPELKLADIARLADLDKATTRRLLVTLIEEGLVRQVQAGQLYTLALGILPLAAAVPTGGLREEARPVMADLARDCGVTVFLSIADPPGALCLERVHGTDPVHVRWWGVGQHMPWNCGAAPRMLLAYMPPDQARAALRRAAALTAHSLTDTEEMLALLPEAKASGCAVATDDVAVGLSAIAVPIRDASGSVVAALSLGGLTNLILTPDGSPRALDRLRAGAAAISAHLR